MRFKTLTLNQEFQELYRRGLSYVGKFVVLYVLPRPGARTRVGFTVGKKLGTAVSRNRVRRRLREIYRLVHPKLSEGYDLVIVARARAGQAPHVLLQRELLGLLAKAGLLEGEGKDNG